MYGDEQSSIHIGSHSSCNNADPIPLFAQAGNDVRTKGDSRFPAKLTQRM